MAISVSVIGKAGHAAQLIGLLKERKDVRIDYVYYPRRVAENELPLTTRFGDLFDSAAVIIASPTPSHFEYLQRLSDFKGVILVEKPLVSTARETEVVRGWTDERKSRIEVNYNLRRAKLVEHMMQVIASSDFGKPIKLDVHTSHGLAFLPKYEGSWRSSSSKSAGVAELVGVHFINLALRLFGPIAQTRVEPLWMAGGQGHQERPPDTVQFSMRMKSGPLVQLFHTYAAPFRNHLTLVGSNGIWEYDGVQGRLYSPRESFDSTGRFARPPTSQTIRIKFDALWRASLAASVGHFIEMAAAGRAFELTDFEQALDSLQPVLMLRRQGSARRAFSFRAGSGRSVRDHRRGIPAKP